MPPVNTLRSAATVIVLRDSSAGPEVFMVRRHEKAAFMGGAYVFPGGAVDAADREAADPRLTEGVDHARRQLPSLDATEALAHYGAAVRELFEEAGILLARDDAGGFINLTGDATAERFARYRADVHASRLTIGGLLRAEGLRLAADALMLCAHWVTPPIDTRRFDTRFFVARLPPHQQGAHDAHETTDSAWIPAAQAIAAAERGEIVLPPPTWITLREMTEFGSVDEIVAWAEEREVVRREPSRAQYDGARALIMPHADFARRWGRAETVFVWAGDRWRPV